jgi:hypothetical protein
VKDSIAIIGALLTIVSVIPYVIDIIKHRTRPNIVSWITWTLLTSIAAAAAYAAHEPRTGLLMIACMICTLSVVVVGARYGIAKFSWFDGFCQAGAVAGLILWLMFNSPDIAIIATVSIDFLGALPTMLHAYKKPGEETWQTFGIGVLGPLVTIISLSRYNIASLLYPIYLVIANSLITGLIVGRRKQLGMNLRKSIVILHTK